MSSDTSGATPIPLAYALSLPEWSSVRLLTGRVDDSMPITKVEVIADARRPVPSTPGALVAVTETVDRDDWHLDTLIRRVSAAHGSALLVGGLDDLHRPATLVADRLGLPVLGTADPLAIAVALRTHLALAELADARWVLAAVNACRRSGAGVDAVVARAAVALGRDIWLVDAAAHLVSGPPVEWASEHELTALLAEPTRSDDAWVSLPVRTDDPRDAYLVISRRPTDRVATLLNVLGVVGEAVAERLARQRLSAERDARLRMSLLSELLRSGGQLAAETPMRMLDQRWTVDGWHLGIRIDVPEPVDPVALRPDVLRAFIEAGVAAQVVEQGSGWAAWSTFAETPSADRLQARSAAIRRVQWRLRSHLPSMMGIGSLQPGPEGLVRSLGEAADAAKIAVTRTAGGHVVQFDRLGLSRLLLAWSQTDSFAPAAASLLTPLENQAGDLLETLAAYLNAESSVSDTAAVLGVHRNTVTARIARAIELLGVDLGDPDERIAVQLACRSVLARR